MFAAGFGGRPRSQPDDQATSSAFVEAAELCLQGRNVNAVNDAGDSALHIAASERDEAFVRFSSSTARVST